MRKFSRQSAARILKSAQKSRVLVIGDLMLDQYLIGRVRRISPEAPVPVVELESENYVPGGAGNVARNLSALGMPSCLFGCVGQDESARVLISLLKSAKVDCTGILHRPQIPTTVKTRVLAHKQQVVRVDRERQAALTRGETEKLLANFGRQLAKADAAIVADYAKGMIAEPLLSEIKTLCRKHNVWLSCDPKPLNPIDLTGFSLLTPNRKEAFELANVPEAAAASSPLQDEPLLRVAKKLLETRRPKLLLITLGEFGMLLCRDGDAPFHIPTAAQEVYDVSGAGDTVIAAFTLAIAAGASPIEAAIFSNHAAGIVVAKIGTAVPTPEEMEASFQP